jgi:hypothetical protein
MDIDHCILFEIPDNVSLFAHDALDLIQRRKDGKAIFVLEDGVGPAAYDIKAMAIISIPGKLSPGSSELHWLGRAVEDLHQMWRKLRFQGVEASVPIGVLFTFRFGGVAFFAKDLQVVQLVASTLGKGYDVVYLTMLGCEEIVTAFALVSLLFNELGDISSNWFLTAFLREDLTKIN